MFKPVDYPVSVTEDTVSDALDAVRINYNGRTQVNGAKLTFYQRGRLMGPATAPLDTNTFSNEVWFKSDIAKRLMIRQVGSQRL